MSESEVVFRLLLLTRFFQSDIQVTGVRSKQNLSQQVRRFVYRLFSSVVSAFSMCSHVLTIEQLSFLRLKGSLSLVSSSRILLLVV